MLNIKLYKLTQNRLLVNKDLTSMSTYDLQGNFRFNLDLLNPVIEVQASIGVVMLYNYLYIEELQRYYFIDNITINDNALVELSLHEDVLFTYSSQINNINGFVERSYSNYDVRLKDNLLPLLEDDKVIEGTTEVYSGATVDTWRPGISESSFIFVINFVTTDSSIASIVDIYSSNNVLPTFNNIFNGDNLNTISIITNIDGLKSFSSWMLNHKDNATSVLGIYAMPFEPKHDTTKITQIKLGTETLTIGGTGDEIQGTFYNYYDSYYKLADFSLLNDTYTDDTIYYWLNYQSKFELWIPFVGWIDLNYNQVKDFRLQLNYLVKASSGKAVVSLVAIDSTSNQELIYTTTCNIGTELPLPNSNAETLKNQALQSTIGNSLKVIGGALAIALAVGGAVPTGGASVGALVGGVSSIASGVASEGKTIQNTLTKSKTTLMGSVNSSSDFMSLPIVPRLRSILKVPTIKGDSTAIENYKREFGLPCQKVLKLGNLKGFGVISSFQVNTHLTCTTVELQEIKYKFASGVLFTAY